MSFLGEMYCVCVCVRACVCVCVCVCVCSLGCTWIYFVSLRVFDRAISQTMT